MPNRTRRHPEKSPFDDKWRRETFDALVAHPHSGAIIMHLNNLSVGTASFWWEVTLRALALEIEATRAARGRA